VAMMAEGVTIIYFRRCRFHAIYAAAFFAAYAIAFSSPSPRRFLDSFLCRAFSMPMPAPCFHYDA